LQFTAGTTTGVLATDGFEVGIDASGNGIISQQENLPLMVYTNSAERLRITAAGNVGIGTASPNNYALAVEYNAGSTAVMTLRNSSTTGFSAMHFLNNTGSLMGHIGYANTSTGAPLTDAIFFGSIASKAVIFTSNDSERMRITSAGSLLLGSTTAPTVTGGTIFAIGDTIFCSGTFNVGSPYSQTLRVDIVWNNWGGNNVAAIVEVDMIAREWANLGGVAFGRVYALSSAGAANFNNALNTSNMTTVNGTFSLSSPANYTLRLSFSPTNSKDIMGYFIKIPNSSGGTGTNISSITASLV